MNHLYVLNIDDAFVGCETRGPLARKCVEVAPRAVHMLGPDDGVLLYAPLDTVFKSYFERLYGFVPRVFAPAQPYTNMNDHLSLLRMALGDPALLHQLTVTGRELGWTISPFIAQTALFDFARATNLSVNGIQEFHVRSGRLIVLNDKAIFQNVCKEIGIPIPPSQHTRGFAELDDRCHEVLQNTGSVFLRRARSAGGLGNFLVTIEDVQASGLSVLEYLTEHLDPIREWEADIVLVEPVLDLVSSPGVLAYVAGDHIEIIGVIDQVLKNKAYIGGESPSAESPEVCAQLIAWTRAYLEQFFVPKGGQGWVNIDFGRCRDGTLVAFESNARMTGSNHGHAVRKRLFNGDGHRVFARTHDAFKVPVGTTFEQVLSSLDASTLWDPERRDGVVITIPPKGDHTQFSMGYIALAQTRQRMHTLCAAMDAFGQQCWARS